MDRSVSALRTLPLFALALGLAFTGCKKDDDAPATPSTPSAGGGGTTNTTASTTPHFTDADASLWGVNTFTSQSTPIGTFDIQAGLGVAVFSNDDFASYTDVGAVTLEGMSLTRNSNNAYLSSISQTNPTGIDFSSGNTEWTVAGANGFGGFTRDITSIPFPVVSAISSADVVVRSSGYTVAAPYVNGADSVIFTVGNVLKTLPANTASCTFSAAELGGVAAGASIVQIAAYTYTSEDIGGKVVYFGKETVRTKSVTVQ